jgi:hypothetical protein
MLIGITFLLTHQILKLGREGWDILKTIKQEEDEK